MDALRHWTPVFENVQVEYSITSTVFSMLPMSLQSRLPPPLRSIRKSVSMQTLKTAPGSRGSSHAPTRSLSGIEAVPLTPKGRLQVDSADTQLSIVAGDCTPPPEYLATPVIREPSGAAGGAAGPASGVHWRYACQGISLINVAQDEARHPLAGSGPEFERKAFLDGAEYLLKALPEDLTPQEVDRLRASLPLSIHPDADFGGPGHQQHGRRWSAGGGKSFLHRGVQAAVVQLFILIHLALPYVIVFLRLAARTEREYKVSQNVVNAGIGLANAIGARGVRITTSLCNMGDGRLGHALVDTAAWAVEGFTGGLAEGVGEGLVLVGLNAQALQQHMRSEQSYS